MFWVRTPILAHFCSFRLVVVGLLTKVYNQTIDGMCTSKGTDSYIKKEGEGEPLVSVWREKGFKYSDQEAKRIQMVH